MTSELVPMHPSLRAGGQLRVKAAVMNHPLRRRRRRPRQLVLACLIVALVAVLLIVLGTVTSGGASGMAPPAGYSGGQLIFDDQFSGTSLNSAHWNTFMAVRVASSGTPMAFLLVTQHPGPSFIRPIFLPPR